MKRVVLHWTGGGPNPNAKDLRSYHFLISQDGTRHEGDSPPEANIPPLGKDYVRHAGGFNSWAIGVGMCGMLEARESPFSAGPYPITTKQYEEACKVVAELCKTYRIAVTRNTVLIHSEVLPRFGAGIPKWDVNWLPGMTRPGDPVEMGDAFRARVASHFETIRLAPAPHPLIAWLRRMAA